MAHTLDTLITALLPPTRTVRFAQVTVEQDTIPLQLTATAPTASCPGCTLPSSAVQSRYQRHVTDLPWGPLAVRLQLFVCTFVCRHPNCVRRIFSERLPDLVATYARNTCKAAASRTAQVLTPPGSLVPVTPMYRGRRRGPHPPPRTEAEPPHRQTPWAPIYEAVHMRHAHGIPAATIAGQLGISRPTVYAYLRRNVPPGPKRPQWRLSARLLTPFVPYLIQRWRESGADSMQLWREIRALGYAHSARTVCRFITALRRASEAGQAPESQASPYTRPQGPSPRAVPFTLVCPAAKRSQDAEIYVDQLCQLDPSIARAYALSQAFLALVRERRGADLETCMAEAMHGGIDELARFARGLQEDLAAITGGLTLAWSNGVTEGQVHRLKLVKPQGFGRAGFALIRQRVLQVA